MNQRRLEAMLQDVATATAALLDTLTEPEWNSRSLCEDWTIRDVAGHLVSGTSTPVWQFAVAIGRARGRFHEANTSNARRVARTTSTRDLIIAIVEPARAGVGRFLPAPLLLGDHVVHLLDIAHATNRTVPLPEDVLQSVLRTELRVPNPFVPAARLGRGLSIDAADIGWRYGRGGPAVQGRAVDLITALAGRPATLDRLAGAGAELLRMRLQTPRLGDQIDIGRVWRDGPTGPS